MVTNYFDEFTVHLVEDDKPSVYFREIEGEDFFNKDFPFTLLSQLKQTEQNPKWHPEGNVWNHTLNVVDNGALLEIKAMINWCSCGHACCMILENLLQLR